MLEVENQSNEAIFIEDKEVEGGMKLPEGRRQLWWGKVPRCALKRQGSNKPRF